MPRYSQTDELFERRALAITNRSRVLSALWLLARRAPRGSSSGEARGVSAQTKREGLFFYKKQSPFEKRERGGEPCINCEIKRHFACGVEVQEKGSATSTSLA